METKREESEKIKSKNEIKLRHLVKERRRGKKVLKELGKQQIYEIGKIGCKGSSQRERERTARKKNKIRIWGMSVVDLSMHVSPSKNRGIFFFCLIYTTSCLFEKKVKRMCLVGISLVFLCKFIELANFYFLH